MVQIKKFSHKMCFNKVILSSNNVETYGSLRIGLEGDIILKLRHLQLCSLVKT